MKPAPDGVVYRVGVWPCLHAPVFEARDDGPHPSTPTPPRDAAIHRRRINSLSAPTRDAQPASGLVFRVRHSSAGETRRFDRSRISETLRSARRVDNESRGEPACTARRPPARPSPVSDPSARRRGSASDARRHGRRHQREDGLSSPTSGPRRVELNSASANVCLRQASRHVTGPCVTSVPQRAIA